MVDNKRDSVFLLMLFFILKASHEVFLIIFTLYEMVEQDDITPLC